ncbi:MAG: hypothetical protein WCI17_06295, partial [bacterium]
MACKSDSAGRTKQKTGWLIDSSDPNGWWCRMPLTFQFTPPVGRAGLSQPASNKKAADAGRRGFFAGVPK